MLCTRRISEYRQVKRHVVVLDSMTRLKFCMRCKETSEDVNMLNLPSQHRHRSCLHSFTHPFPLLDRPLVLVLVHGCVWAPLATILMARSVFTAPLESFCPLDAGSESAAALLQLAPSYRVADSCSGLGKLNTLIKRCKLY